MYGIDRRRYFWVSASALLQGFLLSIYAYASSGPYLALPLSIVLIVPFALWLAQEHWGRRLRRFLLALTALLAVFHFYWLWSVLPAEPDIHYLPAQTMTLTRLCIAIFLFLPFFQCRIATWSRHIPYSEVFFQLCRNVFLLFQAVIVTVTFWALLLTASLLFGTIGLDLVPHVIFSPLAAFPLTSLTIALSITVALRHPGIDSLGRWILSILAWLLPPFSIVSTTFLAALPFSGLKGLWDTGQASSLMLLLQFATIFLANAAWLDGTRSPFSNRIVNGAAKFSLLCLPFYTGLCLYSLGLRVQQYGWSVDRIHAAFFVVVTGIWGFGYAGSVVFLRRQWPSAIGRVNTAAALLLAVIVAAMNSPLLDPYRLAADNQASRLLGGQTNPESFDFLYLRFNLGRHGNHAISRLKEARDVPHADIIRERADDALAADVKEHWMAFRGEISEKRRRDILADAPVRPQGRVLPPRFLNALATGWDDFFQGVRSGSDLLFFFQRVTAKGGEDLLVFKEDGGLVFEISSGDLRLAGTISEPIPRSPDIRIVEPLFQDIEINGRRYPIIPFRPEGR
ncbi:MAG: DUF4153 domain-containing protein [Synergistaceae bacterium]|jgi:hypothetical protein|nr:DUF4153 domain-containing protein [Synergistaceae bacterium]